MKSDFNFRKLKMGHFIVCDQLCNKYFCFTVSAAATIANIVKSSLGPVGLDKMLVDDVGVSAPDVDRNINFFPLITLEVHAAKI